MKIQCLAGVRGWALVPRGSATPGGRFTTWPHGLRPGIYSWWYLLKEDILVWCATRQPFRSPKFQPGPTGTGITGPSSTPSGRSTHTSTGQESCRKFNFDKCIKDPNAPHILGCWLWGRPLSQVLHPRAFHLAPQLISNPLHLAEL